MRAMAEATADVHDALVPRRCPGCGYALRGLPEGLRRCPECGWAWTTQTIVLLGEEPGAAMKQPGLKVSTRAFGWIVVALVTIIGGATLVVADWKVAALLTICSGGFAAVAAWGMQWQAAQRERHWVLLTPDGFDNDRDWREPLLVPWVEAEGSLTWDSGWVTLRLSRRAAGWRRVSGPWKERVAAYQLRGRYVPGTQLQLPDEATLDLTRYVLRAASTAEHFKIDPVLTAAVEAGDAEEEADPRLIDVT